MGNHYILEVREVTKSFGGVQALKQAELLCPENKIIGLLGANGSGKSTISKIINGTLQRDSGTIRFKGQNVQFSSPHEAAEAGISMVYQNLSLAPDLTVWENINLGQELTKPGGAIDVKQEKARVSAYTNRLCPWIDIKAKVATLLPAEKQLVEIIKGLIRQPAFLILDEPTASLEKTHVDALFQFMRELKDEHVTIIFISHRMQEIAKICDCLVVFQNGQTVGTVDLEHEEYDEKKIIEMITGTEKKIREKKQRCLGEDILKVEHLHLGRTLHDINFTLKKGEILGVAGLHGQGQDELMLALAGYYQNVTGTVTIDGEPVTLKNPAAAIQKGLALIPGDRKTEGLFEKHSLLKNIVYPQICLKKNPFLLNWKILKEQSKRVCEIVGIKTPSIHTLTNQLSGGNQQKVIMANWLNLHPKILLLCDPMKGVDVGARFDLYTLVEQMVEEGTSVVLYASDNTELVEMCDRILVLYEGTVTAEFSNGQLTEKALINASLQGKREEL